MRSNTNFKSLSYLNKKRIVRRKSSQQDGLSEEEDCFEFEPSSEKEQRPASRM